MKKIEIIEGVVAKFKGKYWGVQYDDGYTVSKGFGEIDNAEIGDPSFCTKATDMTWNPSNTNGYNHEYELLKNAKVVRVKKVITTEIEEVQ